MRGKYSPTVFFSYSKDQDWFKKNGGHFNNGKNPESDDDDDGFDSYGYSDNGLGVDRAGYTEDQYCLDEELFERVFLDWLNKSI